MNTKKKVKVIIQYWEALMKKKIDIIIQFIIGIFLLIITLFPILWMLGLAVRPMDELVGNITLLPQKFTLEHFFALFVEKNFGTALKNSMITTLTSLVISLACGLTCAYILARSRFQLKTKKIVTYWILLVRVLPPISFAIPLYILFSKTQMLSTLVPVISACVFINIPLTVWFIISFFQGLSVEIEESAQMDGATEWQLFIKVVLPLVLPGIAAISMLSFIYAWNEYTYSVIFVQSSKQYTVPIALSILNTEDNVNQFGQVAAGGIVSLIPMAIFVAFAQKYLISGLSSGAVKE